MSSDWVLDPSELASLFNSRTKAIILNTPHNPIGKVFTQKELELIADLCKKWNVLCIADEVYEWLVYKPYKHIRIGKLLLGHVSVLGNYNFTVFVEKVDKNEHFVFISFYSSLYV
jgi:aspartate/methionine/tyrosine aminotransferase